MRFVWLFGAWACAQLAGCSRDWDGYDPRLAPDPTSTGAGGNVASGGAGASGGATSGGNGGGGIWFDDSLERRRALTVSIPGTEPLADFPLPVRLDPASIDYAVTMPDGADLRFVADDHATVLAHEIESWSPGSESIVWVRIPALSRSPSTFWMYYGGSPSRAAVDPGETWSNGFVAVWHFNANLADATGHGHDGTASGDVAFVAGAVGAAVDFAGTDDFIDLAASADLDALLLGGVTISTWMRPLSGGENGRGRIFDRTLDATFGSGFGLLISHAQTPESLGFGYGFVGQFGLWITPTGSVTYGAWSHAAAAFSEQDVEPAIWIGGAPQALTVDTTPQGAPPPVTSIAPRIGARAGGADRDFNGALDELRVSSVLRSPAWIAAEVATRDGDVVDFGAEQSLP